MRSRLVAVDCMSCVRVADDVPSTLIASIAQLLQNVYSMRSLVLFLVQIAGAKLGITPTKAFTKAGAEVGSLRGQLFPLLLDSLGNLTVSLTINPSELIDFATFIPRIELWLQTS